MPSTGPIGRSLDYHRQRQLCFGDEEANRMLTGPYREPFVVPEQV